jgi:hypothetical protein
MPEFGGYIDSSDDNSVPQGQLPQDLDSARCENAERSENKELSDQKIEVAQSNLSSDFSDIDKLVSYCNKSLQDIVTINAVER